MGLYELSWKSGLRLVDNGTLVKVSEQESAWPNTIF